MSFGLRPRVVVPSRRDFLGLFAATAALTAVGCAVDSQGDGVASDDLATDPTCRATTRDALGPYYHPGAPAETVSIAAANEPGTPLIVEGVLVGPDCRTPLKNYILDLWQASSTGKYSSGTGSDFNLRGKIRTDSKGRYSFQTVVPGRYSDDVGIRPAHIHVTFRTPMGGSLLTTQMYFQGDPYLGNADYCTAQGTCDSSDVARQLVLQNAVVASGVGKRAAFDAVLPRT